MAPFNMQNNATFFSMRAVFADPLRNLRHFGGDEDSQSSARCARPEG